MITMNPRKLLKMKEEHEQNEEINVFGEDMEEELRNLKRGAF